MKHTKFILTIVSLVFSLYIFLVSCNLSKVNSQKKEKVIYFNLDSIKKKKEKLTKNKITQLEIPLFGESDSTFIYHVIPDVYGIRLNIKSRKKIIPKDQIKNYEILRFPEDRDIIDRDKVKKFIDISNDSIFIYEAIHIIFPQFD